MLRGCDVQEIHLALCDEGFDPELARLEIDVAVEHPYIAAARSHTVELSKRDWLLSIRKCLRNLSLQSQIDAREAISSEDFLNSYYASNTPVVLGDVTRSWPVGKTWTPEYLKQRCGECHVDVRTTATGVRDGRQSAQMTFIEFLDSVDSPSAEKCFLRSTKHGDNPDIINQLRDELGTIPSILSGDDGNGPELRFGRAGYCHELIHEYSNRMHTQLYGTTRFLLIPPEEIRFLSDSGNGVSSVQVGSELGGGRKLDDRVQKFEVHVRPGEAIFVPVGWWYQASAEDAVISVVNTDFHWPNTYVR